MSHHLRSALALLVIGAAPLHAQLTELQPGARVRVEAPGIVAGRYVGTVLSRSADTLMLGAPNAAPVAVPIGRITNAEVSRGSSRLLGAGRGIMWGVPIGLGVGVLAAVSSDNPDGLYCPYSSGCGGETSGSYKAGLIVGGTVAGAAWGALIGALVGRERWERFEVTPRSAFDFRDGRTRLGVAVSF